MATGGGSDTKMSEDTFDHLCTSCAKDGLKKEAVKYCVECKGYCCLSCVNAHAKFPALADHSLLDISTNQQTDDQTPRLPWFPTERCSIHQGKVVDMYCGDHDGVGCYACIAIDHKSCVNIHSVPDDLDTISTEDGFNKTCENLQGFIESIQASIQQSNDVYSKTLDELKEKAMLAISENRKEIDAILDRLDENSRQEVETRYQELKVKLTEANEALESVLNKFIELEEKLKQSEEKNLAQNFVCAKITESVVAKERIRVEDVDTELKTFKEECLLTYSTDYSLHKALQQFQSLGKVQGSTKDEPYKVTRSRDIDIRVPSDTKTCIIPGCCLFDEQTILITDIANDKLKRISLAEMKVVDYLEIRRNIHGICNVGNKEVAVGCYIHNMIQFVSVGQTMTTTRQWKLNHVCFHVGYCNNKLYVTDDNGGSVYIYNMNGSLIQTVSKDDKEKKLFTFAEQIAFCPHGDNMFVTAWNDGLVHLDKEGKYVSTTKDTDIDQACGVCVDGRGNVFVSGYYSNNVVQLGYDGTKRGVIVKEEYEEARSVCFKPDTCQLFVTMFHSNKIKVLDLI